MIYNDVENVLDFLVRLVRYIPSPVDDKPIPLTTETLFVYSPKTRDMALQFLFNLKCDQQKAKQKVTRQQQNLNNHLPKNWHLEWTEEDVTNLLELYHARLSLSDLAAVFGRNEESVRMMLQRYGLYISYFDFDLYREFWLNSCSTSSGVASTAEE